MNSAVKEVVQKAHSKNEETRKNKRLEAQSSRRQLCKDDFCHEISEKEFKTLTNLCKSGKLSVSQWRDLSQALNSKADHCKLFVDSDGCLHALVGQLTGSEPSKQVLALQCLVNITGHGYRSALVAKASGAYLITLIAGTNRTMSEYACLVMSNLCLAEKLTIPILMQLDATQNLINLAKSSSDSVQEAAFQALYYLLQGETMSQELSRVLVSTCLRLMKSPRAQPPIHLLWLLYLLSSDQSLHNFLVNQTFLHQCVDISTYEIFQKCDSRPLVKVLTPVVRILANLSAGPDSVSVCLCLVRHPDFPAILTALLSTNYLHLCRESLWLFANIVNNENVTVQEEFVNLDLMDKLESHAVHAVARLDPYALG